jgi:hypothetical protein
MSVLHVAAFQVVPSSKFCIHFLPIPSGVHVDYHYNATLKRQLNRLKKPVQLREIFFQNSLKFHVHGEGLLDYTQHQSLRTTTFRLSDTAYPLRSELTYSHFLILRY